MQFKGKYNICLMLSLAILLLLSILYGLKVTTLKESYDNIGDDAHMRAQTNNIEYLELKPNPTLIDQIQIAAYNQYIEAGDKIIFNNKKDTLNVLSGDYALTDVVDAIMQGTSAAGTSAAGTSAAGTSTSAAGTSAGQIDWKNVIVDDTRADKTNVIKILPRPQKEASNSKKSILSSDLQYEFCEKYGYKRETLNLKCGEMAPENCKMIDCCILLKGNKCVAGDARGPTFLTEDGKRVDQTYYYHKNQCYGNCRKADRYESACSGYTPNSTGISQDCMVKTFNTYGCPNENPDRLINPAMIQSYSKTTKKYVDNYIKTAVNVLKSKKDYESNELCYGT